MADQDTLNQVYANLMTVLAGAMDCKDDQGKAVYADVCEFLSGQFNTDDTKPPQLS